MKNAILFHGYNDSPSSLWYPYAKEKLEERGYKVWAPQLPGNPSPSLQDHLPFVLQNGQFDSETVLIGHSAGCPLILSILENIKIQVKQVILVAGFVSPLTILTEPNAILQKSYNWPEIKAKAKEFVIINSDNDPWGCDEAQGRTMFDNLGGTFILRHGEGHMGSVTFKQPYKEFPFLLKLID